jgi:hypothetical protein
VEVHGVSKRREPRLSSRHEQALFRFRVVDLRTASVQDKAALRLLKIGYVEHTGKRGTSWVELRLTEAGRARMRAVFTEEELRSGRIQGVAQW